MHLTGRHNCPYRSLCQYILLKRSYLKGVESLYSNLIKDDNNGYTLKLLVLIKMILTDEKDCFDSYTIGNFVKEITTIISKPDPLKPDSFFSRNYKTITEIVFEIFLKCKRNEARKICVNFYRAIIDISPTIKKQDTVDTVDKNLTNNLFYVFTTFCPVHDTSLAVNNMYCSILF